MISKRKAGEIAAAFLREKNPSRWHGVGPVPGNFNMNGVIYFLPGGKDLDIGYTYVLDGIDGHCGHYVCQCRVLDHESGHLEASVAAEKINSIDSITEAILEACGQGSDLYEALDALMSEMAHSGGEVDPILAGRLREELIKASVPKATDITMPEPAGSGEKGNIKGIMEYAGQQIHRLDGHFFKPFLEKKVMPDGRMNVIVKLYAEQSEEYLGYYDTGYDTDGDVLKAALESIVDHIQQTYPVKTFYVTAHYTKRKVYGYLTIKESIARDMAEHAMKNALDRLPYGTEAEIVKIAEVEETV